MSINSIILYIFLVIILLVAWALGVIRIFLCIDDFFSSPVSKFIFFILAWLLFPIMGILSIVSIIIGIVEIFRQWTRYRARKQQKENELNISLWREACKNDKIKLIYSYVISFSLTIAETNGLINAEIGTVRGNISLSLINQIGTVLYLMLILPPTLMRFVIFQRKLRYGLEISFCLAVSLFVSLCLIFLVTGYLLPTFGLFATLSVYCILSYKSTEYSTEWHSYTINPTLFMLVALTLMTFICRFMTNHTRWYLPLLEAIFAYCVLTRHKNKTANREPEPPSGTPIQEPRQELRQEPHRPPIDIASELTDIGLALIGRKTTVPNKYLTTERTNERRNIERPFLRLLADRYRDETQRKILARHFMIYKEVTLFLAYSVILKGDKELHYSVRRKLNDCLSLGITPEALKKRNDCWRRISQKFNDEYKRTASMGNALTFSFWSTLAEDNTDWVTHDTINEMLANDSLHDIFRYSYKVVEREYKDLAQQSRQQSRQ